MSVLGDRALRYAAAGRSVFPLAPRTKIPLIKKADGGRGCLDATRDEAQIRAWWKACPEANIGMHCGIASGTWVFDVDVDPGKPGEMIFNDLVECNGIPGTLKARTGGGGWHYFWKLPTDRVLKNRVAVKIDGTAIDGLDVRCAGGYVVLDPSIHESGQRYQWVNDEAELADAPEWLLDLVAPIRPDSVEAPRRVFVPPVAQEADRERRYCERALIRACERIATATSGRRDLLRQEAYTAGGWVGAGLLDPDKAYSALIDAARANGSGHDPHRPVEYGLRTGATMPRRPVLKDEPLAIRALGGSGRPVVIAPDFGTMPDDDFWSRGGDDDEPDDDGGAAGGGDPPDDEGAPDQPPSDPSAPQLTDVGNAQRLVRLHGQNFRHCSSLPGEGWLLWDGSIWVPDERCRIDRWFGDVARELRAEAGAAYRERDRAIPKSDEWKIHNARAKSLATWARDSEMDAKIRAGLRRAIAHEGIEITEAELDVDPWVLGTPNGAIDLRTGALLPPARERLLTQRTGIAYDPKATCPTWRAFLLAIMGGDQSMVDFLQRAVGYSLVGVTTEQIMLILHGNGSNGKSTFTDTIQAILGTYTKVASPDAFLAKREGAISNDIAALAHARLVLASETAEGRRLDEPMIKSLTGDGAITARFLNKEFFTFRPKFTPWLATNHKPVIRGTDFGIWRRLCLIPFEQTFTDDPNDTVNPKKDKEMGIKLMNESAGILAWMVEGCLMWQRDGLKRPGAVIAAVEEYRKDMDVLSAFIEERCEKDMQASADNTDLYASFREWSELMGEQPRSHKWLTRELKSKGYKQERDMTARGWIGLRLLKRAGSRGGSSWPGDQR